MRRLAALLVLTIAAPAAAKPRLPAPIALPPLDGQPRTRPRAPTVMMIVPWTPVRRQPALDERARGELDRRTRTETGHDRIRAMDALAAALEQLDVADAELDLLLGEIAMLYARVLFEPSLATYPYADELIVRAARSITHADEKVAARALEKLLVTFPASPFRADAHLVLAGLAKARGDRAAAKRHLEAIVATHSGPLAAYARVDLAWVLHELRRDRAAVAHLAELVTGGEPVFAEMAASSLVTALAGTPARADHAALLFDRANRSQSAELLRGLATEYANRGKRADEVAALRAAIARDGDAQAICLDRADIVAAMVDATNHTEVELAIAELAEAVRFADAECASAADHAVATLAHEWHLRNLDRADVLRAWTHAIAFATTPARRDFATANRDALASAKRAAR